MNTGTAPHIPPLDCFAVDTKAIPAQLGGYPS